MSDVRIEEQEGVMAAWFARQKAQIANPLRIDLIESGADLVADLPYDTLELRNWGEDSVADPYRIVSEACLDAFLDRLTARAVEWQNQAYVPPECDHVLKFIDVLREAADA